jgi:hypothetical protein
MLLAIDQNAVIIHGVHLWWHVDVAAVRCLWQTACPMKKLNNQQCLRHASRKRIKPLGIARES